MTQATCNWNPELLGWLEAEEWPRLAAMAALDRWLYIHGVAAAALHGQVVDGSLPQVLAAPERYLATATEAIAALSDWLSRQGLDAAD